MYGVAFVRLGDVGKFYGGLTGKSKSDFQAGNASYLPYMNVYLNQAVDPDALETVHVDSGERQNSIQYGDIIFTGSSESQEECCLSSAVTITPSEPIYLNSFCFGLRLFDGQILNPEFAKHLFRSIQIRRQVVKCASGVTRFNLSKSKMEDVVIPIPLPEIQRKTVNMLNRFHCLCNDLTAGLPAEIEARKKQYEHYRDRLLTFPTK